MSKIGNTFGWTAALMVVLLLNSCVGESGSTTADSTTQNADKAQENSTESEDITPEAAENATQKGLVTWVKLEDLEALAKKEPKKVMVDLYTSWCGWCKRMDTQTFKNADIAAYLNENFYAIKLDAETAKTLRFRGKDYEFVQSGRRGYNQLAHNFASGRMSYPTVAFLDKDLEVIQAFPGFKEPHQFDNILHFIKEEHYKTKTLAQFSQKFTSKIPDPKSKNAKTDNQTIQVK